MPHHRLLSSLFVIAITLIISIHASHKECQDCDSSMEDLITNTTVPSHHRHEHNSTEKTILLRTWHHNHSLTLPLVIMCVMTVVFLCFAQASLMIIKRRLTVLKEITVTISASQLEELVEKKWERDQKVFTIAMSPIRGPPSYSSIDLSDDNHADNSYVSHP